MLTERATYQTGKFAGVKSFGNVEVLILSRTNVKILINHVPRVSNSFPYKTR